MQKHALLLGGEQGNTGSDTKSQQCCHSDVSWVHWMFDKTTKNNNGIMWTVKRVIERAVDVTMMSYLNRTLKIRLS